MTRPASPFAPPPPKKAPKARRYTSVEAAEKAHVRERDRGCVADRARGYPNPPLGCKGPLDVDHVRASGGLSMKSPTHRSNMVVLCRWHHLLKTDYGKTWRPLLIAYLDRVEA